ncbi:MAG TPA: glycogen synthase GlgA [Thermoanaerobaculia bacterium]|nr:glycogen synthase GlgA [Thermoanaerobaculia bacterium]
MRVVFATAEVSPIAKSGGLGDVCGSLPKALRKLGHDVTIFMPLHRQAREWFERSGAPIEEALPTTQVIWANWAAEAAYLRAELPGTDIPLYLVANDRFFNREQIYAPRADGYDDGIERFAFFCRAVVRGCELLGLSPDIVHAHDWHTALLPLYLHSGLRGSAPFASARSVYTIHNLNYQGIGRASQFAALGLHSRYGSPDALEHFGEINLMKGGIIFADEVTTVSPHYAQEIQTPEHGAGLDGVLRSLSFKLSGILNGIDIDEWNPDDDPNLASNYSAEKMSGKALSKRALLREAKLTHRAKTPLISFISRLVDQKGVDLLVPALARILRAGAHAVILGSGESRYESALKRIAEQHAERCRVWIGFDNALAHRIYAGSDMLLMPSIYEPCGLNQMYALRYGTVPVVRLTGGLVDTVIPFDATNVQEANGFGFATPSADDLFVTTWLGILNYREAKAWKKLQANGMAADFSWDRSAGEYDVVYRRAAAA